MADRISVLYTEEQIASRIRELGEQISADYAGRSVHLIAILKGATFFACELAKRIIVPVTLDFMSVSSYGDSTVSSGVVKINKDLDEPIEGKDVLVVEDIVDTGNTIETMEKMLFSLGAADVRICTMLLKPDVYKKPIPLDYVALEIPNKFIVGFGLDYNELGRNSKDIYVLDE